MEQKVSFYSEGEKIAGIIHIPDNAGKDNRAPCVVLCHGFAGIKELLLPAYAKAFAEAGYAALAFDYRGFGESEGARGKLVPVRQVEDIRNAITFAQGLEGADPERIALWGSSFGGANAISTAAVDGRVRCVAAQITFGSGERMILGGLDEAGKEKLLGTIRKVWQREVAKNSVLAMTPDQILTDADSKKFYNDSLKEFPGLETKIPLRTLMHIIEYRPEESLKNVRVPLLIIGATDDIVCPVGESYRLYEKAGEPKELFIMENARHYNVYHGKNFAISSGKALEWFKKHL